MVHESLGRCQRQISKGFQGYAVQLQNWPSGNQRTVNKALRGPLKACKHGSLSMVFLLEHSGWRSVDQRLLADIPWCLMSPLGFHWLANERLGQRHWTDKNKVTCLASDVENLFSLQLSLETSWILFSNKTLNLTLSTVSDPHILKCGDKSSDTHSHTPYCTYMPHVCVLSAMSFTSSIAEYYEPGLQKTSRCDYKKPCMTSLLYWLNMCLWSTILYHLHCSLRHPNKMCLIE